MPSFKVSFRLPEPYPEKLVSLAAKANMSEHEFARFLLITAFENPDDTLSKKDLYELTLDSEFLIAEVRELRKDYAKLKVQIAAIASLFLSKFTALTEEETEVLIEEIFRSIEEGGE